MDGIVNTSLNLYVNGFFVAGVKDIATAEEAVMSKDAMNSNPSLKHNLHSAVNGSVRSEGLKSINTSSKENSADNEDSVTISGGDEVQDINKSNYNNLAVYRKLDSGL